MQTLMQSLGPQAAPLFADLFVQGQDFPLADRIAKRMRIMLPPQVAQARGRAVGRAAAAATAATAARSRAAIKQAELQLKQQELQGKGADAQAALKLQLKEEEARHRNCARSRLT